MGGILYTIAAILVALWVAGLVIHIGGNLVHILLVIAIVVVVYNLLTGRRAV